MDKGDLGLIAGWAILHIASVVIVAMVLAYLIEPGMVGRVILLALTIAGVPWVVIWGFIGVSIWLLHK